MLLTNIWYCCREPAVDLLLGRVNRLEGFGSTVLKDRISMLLVVNSP